MAQANPQSILRIMSGEARGIGPALLRGALRAGEALYAPLMSARNLAYDCGILAIHRLPRPVISVGNITAGGTGKTPVVRWLSERLREMGRRPAVLMRGYKSAGGVSDEQEMLRTLLQPAGNRSAEAAPTEDAGIPVHANPDRLAGGQAVLRDRPDVDVFVLDDGFQHRRLGRDVDLVLVDATNPFGHGHVHPRGLLREPLAGLGRAHAIIITRSDQADGEALAAIEAQIRRHNPSAPICRARHVHTGLRATTPAGEQWQVPLSYLATKRFFAFAGIASPRSLEKQLSALPGAFVGCHWYPDHHAYAPGDLIQMQRSACGAGAEVVLVTEKDWPKLAPLVREHSVAVPILRLELAIEFAEGGEAAILRIIDMTLRDTAPSCHPEGA